MNRFFDIEGDLSRQLAPWELERLGKPVSLALFALEEPIRFASDVAAGVIVVPVGYVSDLASIPQFAWSLFMAPDDPRIELGAWIHDLLYSARGRIVLEDGARRFLSRRQADEILTKEAMPELSARCCQRFAVHWALRLFGGRRWGRARLPERPH